jgi:hypothetical protein
MSNQENNKIPAGIRNYLTEGIIIASAPLFGYLAALVYESGYAKSFGIPFELVEVDLKSVFIAMSALIGLVLTFQLLIFLFIDFYRKREDPIKLGLLKVSPWIILFSISFYLFGPNGWKEWIFMLVFLSIMTFYVFIFPIISQRGKKGYREKIKAEMIASATEDTWIGRGYDLLGIKGGLAILLLTGLHYTFYQAGKAEGFKRTEYMVTKASSECAVLRIYHDSMVCAPFDRKLKTIKQQFIILKYPDDPEFVLTLEKIGPLHLEQLEQ